MLSEEEGAGFNALLRLLNIIKDLQANASHKTRALSEAYMVAPTFADHVIRHHLK